MGRRRSTKTRNLPPNLYVRNGYYTWRDPRTGKEHGIGRDRADAVDQAIEANHKVAGTLNRPRLVERLDAEKENSVSAWCDRYQEALSTRLDAGKIAASTKVMFGRRVERFREAWGTKPIAAIEVRDVADLLDTWEAEGKNRMAQAMRSLAYDFFRAAQAKGWIKDNPVTPTKSPDVDVKRARLTLEDFQAIHAVALKDVPVLARAMELALVTGQRREEVLTLGPGNVRDGKLWIEQKKTKMKVRVPLELRLQAVNWSVSEVISRCRDHVLSRTFIHHVSHGGTARPGDRVGGSTLAGWFLAARNQSGRTWPAERTPPSFHEIRSLAARLYHDQGVNAQALLGHKSAEMTALYRDTRGAEWVDVAL